MDTCDSNAGHRGFSEPLLVYIVSSTWEILVLNNAGMI